MSSLEKISQRELNHQPLHLKMGTSPLSLGSLGPSRINIQSTPFLDLSFGFKVGPQLWWLVSQTKKSKDLVGNSSQISATSFSSYLGPKPYCKLLGSRNFDIDQYVCSIWDLGRDLPLIKCCEHSPLEVLTLFTHQICSRMKRNENPVLANPTWISARALKTLESNSDKKMIKQGTWC